MERDGTLRSKRQAATAAGVIRGTLIVGRAFGAVCVLVGALLLAPTALADGPATSVTVSLSPPIIAADGSSTTTATANVTDVDGSPVVGDTVAFSTDGGQQVSATTDNGGGSYSATITSTTTPGQSTITATDTSAAPNVGGSATLTQFGPAANLTLSLAPQPIVADGASTTTATATVSDANGNAVPGDTVVISSSSGQQAAAADRGDGTYSAQIHSTTTPGPVTITATDTSTGVTGQAQLGQTAGPSFTVLRASSGSPVTNQVVTLIATVSAGSTAPISGAVTFATFGGPIGGSCSNEPVSSSSPTAACQVSFSADASPAQLTATFTPDANSSVAGSAGTITLPISADSTATSLSVSNRAPLVRGSTRFTATVRARHSGFAQPAGSVEFLDGPKPISGCARQPLRPSGGTPTATCSAAYRVPGAHSITARFLGDHDFGASQSSGTKVTALGVITAKVRWSFVSTRAYTSVVSLVIRGAPVGAQVVTLCRGRSCPFAKRTTPIRKSSQSRAIDLTAPFEKRRLSPKTQLTVAVIRPNSIGKSYSFVVRTGRQPQLKVVCLAPGSIKRGVGCHA